MNKNLNKRPASIEEKMKTKVDLKEIIKSTKTGANSFKDW